MEWIHGWILGIRSFYSILFLSIHVYYSIFYFKESKPIYYHQNIPRPPNRLNAILTDSMSINGTYQWSIGKMACTYINGWDHLKVVVGWCRRRRRPEGRTISLKRFQAISEIRRERNSMENRKTNLKVFFHFVFCLTAACASQFSTYLGMELFKLNWRQNNTNKC